MRPFFCFLFLAIYSLQGFCQVPKSNSSADLFLQMQKLPIFGSVLYVAAHPDDENTRLLSYLVNERKVQTAYLSLTRGDGGQNLIGNEQGVELGLIRTQELLAARRIDGATQFFTSAYDFGYSKRPEEAMEIWNHDKILADVVYIIRRFKPDVIITRFPTTGEGGHGHHTASGILAGEAFAAAADPSKFSSQLKDGIQTWQAKRLLWNTFNFGGNNTTREDQLKIDCGIYNPVLGKSYGEIAAESRSQHKSQGFGVPAQRGASFEYFSFLKGEQPVGDILSGVDVTANRYAGPNGMFAKRYSDAVLKLLSNFNAAAPRQSITTLQEIENLLQNAGSDFDAKRAAVQELIIGCAGIFAEATALKQQNTIGDSMQVALVINSRLGVAISDAKAFLLNEQFVFNNVMPNENNFVKATIKVKETQAATQPYWLHNGLPNGSFNITNIKDVLLPEQLPEMASFSFTINGRNYRLERPLLYKFTDPVKGEVYEPAQFVQPALVSFGSPQLIFTNSGRAQEKVLVIKFQPNMDIKGKLAFYLNNGNNRKLVLDSIFDLKKGEFYAKNVKVSSDDFADNSQTTLTAEVVSNMFSKPVTAALKNISYDHIPDIFYSYTDKVKLLKLDLKTAGSHAGYIAGAGDKVPEALAEMGYTVSMLQENDITASNLKQFDVVITGVRAYNVHSWLSAKYEVLMNYVKEGGVLLTQYNTNSGFGPIKAKIAPYPFNISRNRITDENAIVTILQPAHALLNYPNIISQSDFKNWLQERSIYHAADADARYDKLLSMNDKGEAADDGSLLSVNYGKGRYMYTGLVFFRELPAGVPGAYRLFANLIARPIEVK